MSLLRYLTPRNLLSVIHVILGIFVLACGIITAGTYDDDQWVYLTITLFLISLFMIATQMYGHKYFAQVGFMYTFGGRGAFYAFVACLLLAAYSADSFVGFVGVVCLILGIINVAVAFFCTRGEIPSIELPLPFFGPQEFSNIHSRLDPSYSASHLPLTRNAEPPGTSVSSQEVFSLESDNK